MKQILLILAVVLVGGCGGKPLNKEESAKVIEEAIRKELKKPTGELTKADLEKVTALDLAVNQLTDVTGLEKLTQLEELVLISSKLTEVPKGLQNLAQLKKLYLQDNQLTDVKALEKLTQLKDLRIDYSPDLTKAQIEELAKALPKCQIASDHGWFNYRHQGRPRHQGRSGGHSEEEEEE